MAQNARGSRRAKDCEYGKWAGKGRFQGKVTTEKEYIKIIAQPVAGTTDTIHCTIETGASCLNNVVTSLFASKHPKQQ
eukprot:6214449-Pleurochrysis_carterae.AAC.1